MTYARLTEDLLAVERWDAMTDADYQALSAANSPKALRHRLQVVDVKPALTASQLVADGPLVIEPTRVRRTWVVVAKPQELIDHEARVTEQDALIAAQAFLDGAAPSTLAQAAADIQKLKRVCKWLLKQALLRGVA